MKKNSLLITGVAGFIGYHATLAFLNDNFFDKVVGIDNLNNYYDINLKKSRVKDLSKHKKNFIFHKINITSHKELQNIIRKIK